MTTQFNSNFACLPNADSNNARKSIPSFPPPTPPQMTPPPIPPPPIPPPPLPPSLMAPPMSPPPMPPPIHPPPAVSFPPTPTPYSLPPSPMPPSYPIAQTFRHGLTLPQCPFPSLVVPPPPTTGHPCMPPPVQIFQNFSVPPPFQSYPKNNLPIDEDGKLKILRQRLEIKLENLRNENKPNNGVKVSSIKKNIVDCFNHLKRLESVASCLQLTYKTLSDSEWMKYLSEAQNIKNELSNLLENMNDPSTVEIMKRCVDLRKKKRAYRKRKVKEWQEQKREAKLFREQEHRRIDEWLENMKDQVSRARREEDIKREADLVLSDVRGKKVEAKRMLKMLNALSKLRAARAQKLSAGKSVSDGENKAFNQIIDRLKKLWIDKINEYNVEEEGLKVMLGHAEEEKTSLETARIRRNLKAWYEGIFGSSSQSYEPKTLDELIQIRHDWDKFICSDDVPVASRIPIGWVLPSEPSSQDWGALLHKKN